MARRAGADDAGGHQSGREGEDDGQWVQADGPAEQQGLQDVAFDLHDTGHHREHDDGRQRAFGDQRDEDDGRAGDHRTDDRYERAEEDECAQRGSQGDAGDEQHQADARGVDEGPAWSASFR
ncbi:hypothetical protein BB31_35085 [Amycolatopsis lurida NRRL 2430]|uniref:Uncharacterized protein n=1 Tax=Amycolatopsis lurida NRRL 2430 TaxID=1460371 RepID=A0A2P2FIX5_AMYLU|nr:hypothetical protein BB31_35085 [Amycolatopsis lurida NRRL 2430]